jgi:hypothetical protein
MGVPQRDCLGLPKILWVIVTLPCRHKSEEITNCDSFRDLMRQTIIGAVNLPLKHIQFS